MALKINTANGSVTLSPEDGSGNVAVAIPRGNLASETYVATQISTLVDSAPGALDTLNELAAALGDDPNFATTVTNSLALKANTADLSTIATTGDYSDILNPPTIPTDVSDLTDTGSLLTHFDGAYSSLTGVPVNQGETVDSLTGTEIDPANGGIQTKTLSGSTTFTEVLSSGDSVVLMIDGGDANAITWPTITWVTSSGNAAPTLTANDTIVLWKVSTTLYGAYTGSYT